MRDQADGEPTLEREDGFAIWAFRLALFIMVLPIQADMLAVCFAPYRMATARAVALGCFLVVFTPFLVSLIRRMRVSQGRSGRGYLIATGVILISDVFMIRALLFR